MAEVDTISSVQDLFKSLNENKDEDRIAHILSNLFDLASGNFDIRELPEIQNDSLDAIDRGLVMLGEQLEANKRQHEQFMIEKENLLKEVHHRVKNNLQIISSLLNLQMAALSNDIAKQALKQSQHRIRSMALIHEMLYKSDDISEVMLKDYLEKMVSLLLQSIRGIDHRITSKLSIPTVKINLDTAVSLGLMVNEIITNSLIHGLKEEGEIYIEFNERSQGQFELKIGDNGIGYKDKKESMGLGLQLIEILADQLQGSITKSSANGMHYCLLFEIAG